MSYDQSPWERADEEIARAFAEKDKEIKRLRADVEYWHHIATEKNQLITELADALDDGGPRPFALIQRAREAIR